MIVFAPSFMTAFLRNLLAVAALGALAAPAPSAVPAAQGSQFPGKFIWFNLATPDAAVAQSFYGAVFGWEFNPAPGGGRYTVISHDGREIGAVVTPPAAAQARGARWISLMAVTDAGAAVRVAREHGATVLVPATNVAHRGTHALLRDADGALFGLLQSSMAARSDELEANEFFWADLLTREPAKAAEFYRALAGFEVTQSHLGEGVDRIVLSSGGVRRAGIAPLPKEMQQAGWLPYVVVDDVPATLDVVNKAGGRIVLAPSADLLGGQLAVFADPTGGVLGIVKWTSPAKN
jgi:predicted enzyme related to lactoylglutathione lyase